MSEINVQVVRRSAFGADKLDRLDAEYVESAALCLEESLTRLGSNRLEVLSLPYGGPVVNNKLMDAASEVDYVDLDAVDLADGLIYVEPVRFGDRPSRAKYVLSEGDILVANVRPNRGAIAWITASAADALGSSGFTWIRPKENSPLAPECLYLFLRTRHARIQLIRRSRGSMYPAVLGRDVLDTVVPNIPDRLQSDLQKTVRHGLKLQEEFTLKLEAADKLIDSILRPFGSPPSPLESQRAGLDITSIRRKDAFGRTGVGRIDAEFFRREYEEFHQRVREAGDNFKLGDLYALQPGKIYAGEGTAPTLKQGCLTNRGINWSAVHDEPGSVASSGAQVKDGDILLAATAHEIFYVGRKVDIVREMPTTIGEGNQAVADLMILRPRPETSGRIPDSFTAAFLRHPAGLYQVQRCIRGLRGGHVYARDLEEYVLIPDVGKDALRRFDEAWLSAERTRREARLVIEEATETLEIWLTNAGVVG